MDWSKFEELTLVQKLTVWRAKLVLEARRSAVSIDTLRTISTIEDLLVRLDSPLSVWQSVAA